MNIEAMVLREDFYSINEKTLEKYYKNILGYDLKISTHKYSIFRNVYIYPKINAIVTRFPSHRVLEYILSEFNIRNNLGKYIIGKLYVIICLFSGGLMSTKTLLIQNFSPLNKNILIWPCNRKIRIFNFENNTVDSIVKESFTKKYFNNEVKFRIQNTYSFVPAILDYGENWYREPLLPGQPLARVTNENQYIKSCYDAISFLKTIADSTLKLINVDDYTTELLKTIDKLIKISKVKKKISTGDNIYHIAQSACKRAKFLQCKVPLVLSHGDLQSGNIWVDTKKGETFVIDWETNGLRSIWYDSATLLLSTRRHNGMINMVKDRNTEKVKKAVLFNDSNKEYDMDAVIGILILEDIIFYLEDNLELQLDWGGDLIDRYGKQLMQLKW